MVLDENFNIPSTADDVFVAVHDDFHNLIRELGWAAAINANLARVQGLRDFNPAVSTRTIGLTHFRVGIVDVRAVNRDAAERHTRFISSGFYLLDVVFISG